MSPTFKQVRQQLFSGRRYSHSTSAISSVETPGQSSTWLVSRGLSTYHCVDLTHLDSDKRESGLLNHLHVVSPFENPGSWVSWHDGVAQVWVWDLDVVEQTLTNTLEKNDHRALVGVISESAYVPRLEDGLQAYAASDGFVLQYWRQGVLREERFWQNKPDDKQIADFARGVGIADGVNQLEWLAPREYPWANVQTMGSTLRTYEPLAVTFASLIFVTLLSFQLFSWVGISAAMMSLENDIAALEDELEPVMRLRDRTYETRDRNNSLQELRSRTQLELMNTVTQKLPEPQGESGRLMRWEFQNDELSFVIHEPVADLEVYAAAIDGLVEFGEVDLVPNDRSQLLTVNVRLRQ